MKTSIRNPHPFDMSNYFSGTICVVGGRDFEREEKEPMKAEGTKEVKNTPKLDWSFLKTPGSSRRIRSK